MARAPAPRGRPPKAPPRVAAYVEQLSGELHDDEHVRSNIGQAARLWHGAGLTEADFLGLLLEARTRTKARGNIEKRADGEAGEWGLTNRMPYFFACLRELLDEASPPAQP